MLLNQGKQHLKNEMTNFICFIILFQTTASYANHLAAGSAIFEQGTKGYPGVRRKGQPARMQLAGVVRCTSVSPMGAESCFWSQNVS
jgi:hypothetical protein